MSNRKTYKSLDRKPTGGSPIMFHDESKVSKVKKTYRSRDHILKSLKINKNHAKIGKIHEGSQVNLPSSTTTDDAFGDTEVSLTNSTMGYIPDGISDDSDGDDLINIDDIPPKKIELASTAIDFSKLDKLVENNSKRVEHIENTKKYEPEPKLKDITAKNLIENILQTENIHEIKQKYHHKSMPNVPNSKKIIESRIENYLPLIPKLLDGTMQMSFFYDLAKQQRLKASNQTIRQRDKYLINWSNFIGGYYGRIRQQYISKIIMNKFIDDLHQSLNTNSTVQFWGIEDFTKFVLANEIIIRLIMEDYHCDFLRAEHIIKDTSDYGIITDEIDLED